MLSNPIRILSFKLEIQRSIDRGLSALAKMQDAENGSFGDAQQPALTALAVSAFMGNPERQSGEVPEAAREGLRLSSLPAQKPMAESTSKVWPPTTRRFA